MAEKHPFDSSDEENKSPGPNFDKDEITVYKPEAPNEQMVIKPFCECPSCDYWVKGADWCPPVQQKFECKRQKILVREKNPLLKSEKNPGEIPKIVSYNPDGLTKIEKETIQKSLAHGAVIPEPIKALSEAFFTKDLVSSLEKLNYRYTLPIQSFAWPAIFKKINIMMIGDHKSGKTLAYLPVVCTIIKKLNKEKNELSKYKGPSVIIICANSKQCEEIYDLIQKIYYEIKNKLRVTVMTYPLPKIHHTDIIVTIPGSLTECLKSRIFNLKKMSHLILEDTSTLLKNHESTIYKILEVTDEMLEHRSSNIKVQVIATSQKWTSDLLKLLKILYSTPLVCINNYLEAALYAKIQIEVKFLTSDLKLEYLRGVLKDKYRLYKTIVICNEDEITDICKYFIRNGLKTMVLSENSTKEEIEANEVEWAYMQGGYNRVLVCTDFVFDSLLSINDANWLINYSFPATWTRFTKRFAALSSYYKSPLDTSDEETQCKSFIMIDETCEKQMPKILNLLNRLTKDFPENYKQYAESFRHKMECNKIQEKVDLCGSLKLFGKCSNSLCEWRHLLDEKLDVSDDLPKSGKVTFKIIYMKDVTQYAVQILEHITLDGKIRKIKAEDLKKPLVYNKNIEVQNATNIKVGKFYAHCDHTVDGKMYSLCNILSIENDIVDVRLMNGLSLQTFKSKLFELPSHLNLVDIYFCNLIPPFNDEYFSTRSFSTTRTSLENLDYKNIMLTGTILLQLDHTLWLDDIMEMFRVEGADVIKLNLTKHLVKLNVVEPSKNQISLLHKLCTKCEIELPIYVKLVAKKSVQYKDVEPQAAFLDDNVAEVILSSAINPDEFYVRLVKFQPLLDNLEKEIQETVKNEIIDNNLNVEIGKYYLGLDPKGETYARVKILKVEDNKVLCFYVDYGDEAVLDISTIKILPTKLLTKLPFQAIQCRLYGLVPSLKDWDNAATDVLYKYMFEPDSDIFRSLFVEVRSKDDGDIERAKIKYSVLMKDGFGESKLLLNQLLLDCGFASSIFDKIDDFCIPEAEVLQSDSDSELDECVEKQQIQATEESINEEDFDFQVQNPEVLFKMLGLPDLRQTPENSNKSLVGENISGSSVETKKPTVSDVQSSETSCLTPEVYWSQTDTSIKLKIKVIGVQQYKTSLIQKRIFTFSTILDDKTYALKFTLFKPVELKKHCAFGQEVHVYLNKIEPHEWLQLTGSAKRLRFIHYELPDVEEKITKRKILTLDITDSESDNDGNGPMYHTISDFDSDLDPEVQSSDDD